MPTTTSLPTAKHPQESNRPHGNSSTSLAIIEIQEFIYNDVVDEKAVQRRWSPLWIYEWELGFAVKRIESTLEDNDTKQLNEMKITALRNV